MRITRFIPLAALALSATVAGAQKPKHPKKVETQADLQKEAKLSMDDARAIALKEVPDATIQSGEIEREGGKLIYSFDMKVAGKTGIDEVNIDAKTGKLVSHERETPADEGAEAKEEAKTPKKAVKKAVKKATRKGVKAKP